MNGFSRHITFIAIVLCGILIAPLTPHAQGAQHGQNIPTDPVVACRKGAELIYMGDLATALDYLEYGFAARATGQFDDVNDLATCAFMLALVREQFVDWEGAIEAYQLAGEIYMETDDAIGMFTVVKGIGFASQQLGNYQDALTYNNIAVQFAEILTEAGIFDDASELVNLWVRIGNVEQSRGLHQQALIAYQAAQELLPMIDDEVLKIDVLINLGEIQRTIGLYADAQTSLEDARTKARRAHDRFYEAVAYAALGSMYEDQGDLGVATEHYMLALHVAEDSEISALEATIRNNLGLVFYAQGRYTDAGEQYELALEAAAADEMLMQSDPSFTEQIKLNKSMVLRQKHTNRAYLDALTLLKEILTVAQDMGKQQLESNVFNQMALVHYDMGDLEQALLLLRESAAILEQLNDPLNQARTRENIAELTYELGDSDAALALLLDVLETFEELGAQEEIGAVLATIGIIYTEDGDNDRGLEFIMDAIDVLDTVRARAGSLEGRSWFSGQYANVYRVAVRLLHEQGRDEDALAVSERGKARAFNDMMSTSTIRLSDTDAQELLDNEGAAFRQMRLTEDELRQKRANPEPEKSSIQLLETQLEEDRATHAATVKQLDAYLDATGRLDPEDMAVASLEEIKAALDGSSTLIAYHIVSDVETVAFVITKNDVVGVTLPMGQTELSRNIATFRDFSDTKNSHPLTLKRLYNALYVPLRRYVHTDNLIIVPHGELHYLPFGALTNGVRYLDELYTISYLPSASTLSRIHGKSTIMDTDVLILGNPDTTEGSVPGAEQEALAIGALFDVEPLLRKDATERALFLQASDAAIIHIAAHGNLDPVDPMTSTIYLAATPGSDGRLTVKDIFSLDLHENTDLVSLSGCETKVGNTGTSSTFRAGSEGDDLIVLNRAFMVAGASSVVASLWSVDDEATVPILTQFYENIRDGMGKAEALRSAQITVRHNYPEFAHPRYWAAFVLTGDGK